MVKLASARESRLYGPRAARTKSEYINAGLYLFSTIVLINGFIAQLSREAKSGLVLMLIAFVIIMIVNIHDLFAHLAGIHFRLLSLMEFDLQLALVEFAVPIVHILGTILYFLGILFLFIQEEKGYGHFKLEKHALNVLIAGPALWLLGSIHNSCQIYETTDGHIQVLQKSVHIPFLIGSVLFLAGAIINTWEQNRHSHIHHGLDVLGGFWIWFSIFGSIFLCIGGLANVVKVFKMQQIDGPRLEKLRGGAQERLYQEREGQQEPLIENQTRKRQSEIRNQVPMPIDIGDPKRKTPVIEEKVMATSYKDVLVGGQSLK